MNPHYALGVIDGILSDIHKLEKNIKRCRKSIVRVCKQESKGDK